MALAASVFQPLSLANCYLNSSSTPKSTPSLFLSIPSKPLKHLPLFFCYSSSSKKLPLWRPSLTASVAQTSDWAPRQDEDEDAGFDWEQQQQQQQEEEEEKEKEEEEVVEGAEAGLSEWEGEGGELAESSDEESAVDGEDLLDSGDEESAVDGEDLLDSGDEDSYLPPPEEAKLFVGNLTYNVESADLAALFDQAGVVESAEVEFRTLEFIPNYRDYGASGRCYVN